MTKMAVQEGGRTPRSGEGRRKRGRRGTRRTCEAGKSRREAEARARGTRCNQRQAAFEDGRGRLSPTPSHWSTTEGRTKESGSIETSRAPRATTGQESSLGGGVLGAAGAQDCT